MASSAKDIVAEPTPASEFVHCRLEQIHEYDPEVRVGVKSKDPQMTTVDDEAAQPEKQPIVDDEEADLQSRCAVSRRLKESRASLFAHARTRKSVASSATATAAKPTPASEVQFYRLDRIHTYDPEIRIGLKSNDPRMMPVDDEAAQPEKQPTEASPKPQPRRPGLTLRRWPGKTEKSSS